MTNVDAQRIYSIRLVMRRLAAERENSQVCGTVAGVREARARAVADIRAICDPEWCPEDLVDYLRQLGIDALEEERHWLQSVAEKR